MNLPCQKCGGGPPVEQPKFHGLFICPQCRDMTLTATGAREFHIELCREAAKKMGVTICADEIIAAWNEANPGDEW